MQTCVKEAYATVSQVLFLFIAFLRARSATGCFPGPYACCRAARIIGACLDGESTLMRDCRRSHARRCARLIPLARMHGWTSSALQKAERDQTGVQALKMLSRGADRVRDMGTLEKRAPLPPILYRQLPHG